MYRETRYLIDKIDGIERLKKGDLHQLAKIKHTSKISEESFQKLTEESKQRRDEE